MGREVKGEETQERIENRQGMEGEDEGRQKWGRKGYKGREGVQRVSRVNGFGGH